MSGPHVIRLFGDPVLKTPCAPVATIDDSTRKLAADMLATMYDAPGVGLAANQIGVQQRIFVYDAGNGPDVIVNPTITETSGEWSYEEGCLSVPGLFFNIIRPKIVKLQGQNLDGEEINIVGDEFLARVLQHEVDHLNGLLLLDRLDPESKKSAMRSLRERQLKA